MVRLGGSAKFDFTDGATAASTSPRACGAERGVLTGWQENAAEKTDFAALDASFKIANGRAETRLHLATVRMAVASPAPAN
jgi:AsmA protein